MHAAQVEQHPKENRHELGPGKCGSRAGIGYRRAQNRVGFNARPPHGHPQIGEHAIQALNDEETQNRDVAKEAVRGEAPIEENYVPGAQAKTFISRRVHFKRPDPTKPA